MRPELVNVLHFLSEHGYSVSSLVEDVLGSQTRDLGYQIVQLTKDQLERDAVDICAHLFNHAPTSGLITSWAHRTTQTGLRAELETLSKKEWGFRFNAGAATVEQIESLFMPRLAGQFREISPSVWRLVYTLLGALDERRQYLEVDPLEINLSEVFEESERDLNPGDLGGDTRTNDPQGDDGDESESDQEDQQRPRKRSRRGLPAKNTALRIIVSRGRVTSMSQRV
jgi:hypothetical protein